MSEEIREIKGIDEFLQMSMCNNMPLSVNEKRKIFDLIINLQNQLQQKENIIKEVREYILKEDEWVKNSDYRLLKTDKLLEILDKENK